MNSYYSNLIEGHTTHPVDIERALKKKFSKDSSKRVLQIESVAHIQVQELLEKRLERDPELEICSLEFLSWIHYEFYKRLPAPLLLVKTEDKKKHKIIPGEIRELPVEVGDHLAPDHKTLSKFLKRFQDAYGEKASLPPIKKILALGASHHRLAWIHPFLDGNGRVTRLFSHAFLIKCDLGGGGLWTLSRGLARNRDANMGA
jgi:Fic family protein